MSPGTSRAERVALPKRPALSLAVPCYNEAGGIRRTVEQLLQAFAANDVDIELVLVDNGSSDETGEVINAMIRDGLPVVKETVAHNVGYGKGALCGLAACRGDIIGVVPADLQVGAHDVVRLYDVLANATTARLAKVRRRFRMDGAKRKIVSFIFNIVVNVMFFGVGSIDVNGSPKMFPRKYLRRMRLRSTDWFLDTEILLKAKLLGLPVFEMNVLAQAREDGESNVHAAAIGEFITNICKWRFDRTWQAEVRAAAFTDSGGVAATEAGRHNAAS